ncbi:hypothetical protein ASC90_27365 [Rhizobium sp. Root1220]|nr:hypothetical protein ASC90_27365 [Rhizobium sp. Root1220]
MKKMRIEAIYRRPNTSKPTPGHKIYPYLLDHFWLEFSGAFSWLGKERKTMKASQFSDAQKAFILKQGDEGGWHWPAGQVRSRRA